MIDLLAVGHCARDEFADGSWRLGGTALYGAITAARLGARTALVTRVAEREREPLLACCRDAGVELVALPANVTTTFSFRYDDAGHRQLTLKARAKGIALADVAGRLRVPRAVLFGSIAHELSYDVFDGVVSPVSVLVAQGYLRAWDATGLVRPRPWDEASAVLPRVGTVVISEDDIGGDYAIARGWAAHTTVIVTRAELGARIVRPEDETDVPGFPTPVVDQTGAGDAFAAALAVGLSEGRELVAAVRFANGAASFAVEGPGTTSLSDRAGVVRRTGG